VDFNYSLIIKKIEKNDLSAILLLIRDVDYFVEDIIEKLKNHSSRTSIRDAFKLIMRKADLNLIHYMLDSEYLELLLDHPKINLIEIINEEANKAPYHWFMDIMIWFYERVPSIVKKKIFQLVLQERTKPNVNYICYFLRIASVEKLRRAIDILGSDLIKHSVIEFINKMGLKDDIYYILDSDALVEMIENPEIEIITIIKNTLSEGYVDDTIFEEYIDWIKERAPSSLKKWMNEYKKRERNK